MIVKPRKDWTYPTESVDVSSLMATCQSPLIAFSIGSNVLLVAQTQLFYGLLDHLKATIISHWLGAKYKEQQTQIIKTLLYNNLNKFL